MEQCRQVQRVDVLAQVQLRRVISRSEMCCARAAILAGDVATDAADHVFDHDLVRPVFFRAVVALDGSAGESAKELDNLCFQCGLSRG